MMAEAIALGDAARGRTAPNPNVGCVIVSPDGEIVGRGATQPGGRPHAEAVALAEAGPKARGATLYTTLEPCAHVSERGPACAPSIAARRHCPGRRGDRGSRPAHRRQGHRAAQGGRASRSQLGFGAEAAERIAGRLPQPDPPRPPAHHA